MGLKMLGGGRDGGWRGVGVWGDVMMRGWDGDRGDRNEDNEDPSSSSSFCRCGRG
jgi:hypothetical protein